MTQQMSNFTHISLEIETDLDSWDVVEERPPTGSRAKLTLNRVTDGQHFVFKLPNQRREHQIWSELLGSYIAGDLLGWDVQHVTLGVRENKPGNLLRYIYRPNDGEQFIDGWRLCKEIDPEFDVAKGRRHTFPLLLHTYADVIGPRYNIERYAFLEFWSRAFALDTMISNTDRHAENWAIVTSPKGNRMAAIFDNGSSMGCGTEMIGLERDFDQNGRLKLRRMEQFKRNGRHHVRLKEPAKRGALFEELCRRLLICFPEGRGIFEQVASIDLDAVRTLTEEFVNRAQLPAPYGITARRAEHICATLQIGMQRISNVLRG